MSVDFGWILRFSSSVVQYGLLTSVEIVYATNTILPKYGTIVSTVSQKDRCAPLPLKENRRVASETMYTYRHPCPADGLKLYQTKLLTARDFRRFTYIFLFRQAHCNNSLCTLSAQYCQLCTIDVIFTCSIAFSEGFKTSKHTV